MKYRLKKSSVKTYKEVCLRGDAERIVEYHAGLPRPNTTQKIIMGSIGPIPGSWLGCKLGSHDFYGEHEVELEQ